MLQNKVIQALLGSIGRYAEIQFTACHQFNTVNSFDLTGLNGDVLGGIKKLNLIFRG